MRAGEDHHRRFESSHRPLGAVGVRADWRRWSGLNAVGYTYALACPECRHRLWIGKLIPKDDRGQIRWAFGGRRFPPDTWVAGERLLEIVEHFLVLHRGHALSLLSDELLIYLDVDWRDVDTWDEAFGSLEGVEPDGPADAEQVSETISGLLRKVENQADHPR